MIVCTNCGNHNEDRDEFCGSCGKFLEWVGQRIDTPAPAPEVQAEPEPEPVKAGLIDRVKAVVGMEDGLHAPAARPEAPQAGDGGVTAGPAGRRQAEEEERAYQEAEEARRAHEEAEAAATARAEAARRAEAEARRRTEDEARARADAEERRQAEADAARRAEQERRAVEAAAAEAAAAAASARQAERDAQTRAVDAATQVAVEAEAARRAEQAAAAEAALEEAKRAEERARLAAEAEARALQEAQLKERQEAEARRAAEEQARREAAEEARSKAAAEARAREEEAARKRAAALLQRARPAPAAVFDEPPAPTGAAPVTAATSPAAPVRPAAQQPVAQQPSSAKTPPRPDPKVKAAEKVLKPDDLVCGQCGEGNDPTRKFCRKCGNSLAQAAPAKKIPWWKKLFSGKSRVSKEAGARGSKVRAAKEASFKVQIFLNTLRRVLMVLAFLGVAGSFAIPSTRTVILDKGRSGAKAAQNLLNPQFEPVNAVEVSASSAIEGHGANFANDLGSNTYWAEGAEGEGIGQTISFSFENKVDLTRVIVSSGAADPPDNFLKQPRPKRLHLVFDNGGSVDIVLKDQFKPQSFGLKGAKGVSKVDIAIVEVYKGQSGTDTAIAEVEFKKKG